VAGGANNAREVGLSVVRERFDKGNLFILKDALESVDGELAEARKPICTIQEIPNYLYRKRVDGRLGKEEPAPDSDDHGCDAMRYAMMHLDVNDWCPDPIERRFPLGSYGSIMGHQEVLLGWP
jgi:phage terminase large subunit